MRRRGVLDPARIDRSVRSVAILDTNSGENVDAIFLVYPSDDASVVARTRAMKGLILALRGATRSLSGATRPARRWRGRRGEQPRQGRVGGSGAHRSVVSGGDDVRGRRARGATRGDDGGAHPLPARGLVGRPSARRARRASRRRRRHERGFRCVGRRRKPNATFVAPQRDDRVLPAHEGGVGTRAGRRPRGSRDTRRAVRGGDGDAAFG